MNARFALALLIVSLFALTACDENAMMSSTGFRLPDGDAEAGRDAFLYMQCHQCHSIKGMELPTDTRAGSAVCRAGRHGHQGEDLR